jgi:hypothetical protein
MRNLTPRELAEATGDHDAIHGPARHLDAKDMIDGPRWVTPACMAVCLMSRDPDGTINHWTVYLHFNERCVQGIGDTPSGALGKAFAKQFEDAAERAAA